MWIAVTRKASAGNESANPFPNGADTRANASPFIRSNKRLMMLPLPNRKSDHSNRASPRRLQNINRQGPVGMQALIRSAKHKFWSHLVWTGRISSITVGAFIRAEPMKATVRVCFDCPPRCSAGVPNWNLSGPLLFGVGLAIAIAHRRNACCRNSARGELSSLDFPRDNTAGAIHPTRSVRRIRLLPTD